MEDFYPRFGKLVSRAREKLGLTQVEAALELEISRITLAMIETGKQRTVLHRGLELCAILKIPPEELFKCLSEAKYESTVKNTSTKMKKTAEEFRKLLMNKGKG